MKIWVLRTVAVAAATVACPAPARPQQTTPAPVALAGEWELDRDLTDRPQQIVAAVRADFAQAGGDQLFGGFEGGRVGRGGRRGGEPPPRGAEREQQPNREDQERLDAITAPLRYPPTRLTIAQSETTVTFTEPQGQPRTIEASGKRQKATVGGVAVDVTARFEGPQLIVEQDIGKGRIITWTYAVLPATRQLLVRVSIARAPGEIGPFEIKHVYDRGAP